MVNIQQRYDIALDWLYSRQNLGIIPGLERIEALLASVGDPHFSFRSVHVAGTNGKGSVATMLAKVLELSGHRTGLYTSPHLVAFEERIRVDGEQIARNDLLRHIETVRAATDELDLTGLHASFFEICTVLAFLHFRHVGCAWVVVEAGMGGGLDATNVIAPDVAVITNVSRDHTAFLGDDLRRIATEKAGVIKPGTPLVTAASGVALDVIEEVAAGVKAPVIVVGSDYLVEDLDGEMLLTDGSRERRLVVAAAGKHQLENAALVVAASDSLSESRTQIDPDSVRRALAETSLAGRLAYYNRDGVTVVIDGAHNPASVDALADHLLGSEVVFDLVVGFSGDKDWPVMLDRLAGRVRKVWAVPIRTPRSLDPKILANALPPDKPFEIASSFEEAWHRAVDSGVENLLVTGSLFLAGEATAVLEGLDLSGIRGTQ